MNDEKRLVFKGQDAVLPQQVELAIADIKKYLAPKASDAELYMFVQIARSQGLNPFAREIHFVPFGSAFSVVVGYEAYIKRVEASGACEWWEVSFDAETEEWVFRTKRRDWTREVEWRIDPSAYNKGVGTWKVMPAHMGRKVAISQGMRMFYADIVSGLPYSAEEATLGEGMIEAEAEITNVEDKPRPKVDDLKASKPKAAPAKAEPSTVPAESETDAPPVDGSGGGVFDPEKMEADDIELHIASLINKNATKEDVDKIIKLVDYPTKKDPMNLYDGQTTGNPQRQLARLARFYRNKRAEEQEREPGQDE